MLSLAVLLMAGMAGGCALGTRHPRFGSIAPTVRTVAIVPFAFEAPLEVGKLDATGAQRVAESVRRSAFLHLQQRQQDGKLTTRLQTLQDTDDRLAGARLDTARSSAAGIAAYAAAVEADAVLHGVISEYDDPSTGGEVAREAASLVLGGILGALVSSKGGTITCTYRVYHARTHEVLWEFRQSMSAGAFKGPEDMLAKFGAQVAKHYPFKR
jgi:hypothetical protein